MRPSPTTTGLERRVGTKDVGQSNRDTISWPVRRTKQSQLRRRSEGSIRAVKFQNREKEDESRKNNSASSYSLTRAGGLGPGVSQDRGRGRLQLRSLRPECHRDQ